MNRLIDAVRAHIHFRCVGRLHVQHGFRFHGALHVHVNAARVANHQIGSTYRGKCLATDGARREVELGLDDVCVEDVMVGLRIEKHVSLLR